MNPFAPFQQLYIQYFLLIELLLADCFFISKKDKSGSFWLSFTYWIWFFLNMFVTQIFTLELHRWSFACTAFYPMGSTTVQCIPRVSHWLVWNTLSRFLLLVSVAWTLFRMLEQPQHVSRFTWGFHVLLWLAMCMLIMLVLVSLAKLVSRSILSSIISLFSRLFIASHHCSIMNTPMTYVIIMFFFYMIWQKVYMYKVSFRFVFFSKVSLLPFRWCSSS